MTRKRKKARRDRSPGYEIHRGVDGQVRAWAVTRGVPPADEEEQAKWADWSAAVFTPLEQADARLAEEVAGALVDAFLSHGGLSAHRKDEALAGLRLRRGVTPRGTLILGADLPLGEGHPEYGWDGSHADALRIARSMGETAGETISDDRGWAGPTGWEPEDDEGSP